MVATVVSSQPVEFVLSKFCVIRFRNTPHVDVIVQDGPQLTFGHVRRRADREIQVFPTAGKQRHIKNAEFIETDKQADGRQIFAIISPYEGFLIWHRTIREIVLHGKSCDGFRSLICKDAKEQMKTSVLLGGFRQFEDGFQRVCIICTREHISVITIEADPDIVLLEKRTIGFVRGGFHQPIHANAFGVFIAAVHELTAKDRSQDRFYTMLKKQFAQPYMVLDGFLHVACKEVAANLIAMLEHKPAPRAVDREHAHFMPRGPDPLSNVCDRELEETLKGYHRLLHRRG